MAKMLGVWINVNNPGRSPQEDLHLSVNGTILLTPQDVAKLVPGQLFHVRIKVMDDEAFSDDLVHTDETFERGVYDTNPTPFTVGVIVPATRLRHSEPGYDSTADIYCRVAAEHRNTQGRVVMSTNAANSQTVGVRI
jgi:hypothetical protein